jgi:structure-specific endonuclease subunit SLX1
MALLATADETTLFSGLHGFLGVYTIVSDAPACSDRPRSYIGFTNDPSHRIRQHNGEVQGGASKTRFHRPWRMVCVVFGHADNISALQFEWHYTYPDSSTWLKDAFASRNPRTFGRRGTLKFNLSVLRLMLSLPPWKFQPLRINVFEPAICPPEALQVSGFHTLTDVPFDLCRFRPGKGRIANHEADPIQRAAAPSPAAPRTEACCICLCVPGGAEGEDESASPASCLAGSSSDARGSNGGGGAGGNPPGACPRCHAIVCLTCLARWMLQHKTGGNDPTRLIPSGSAPCPMCRQDMQWQDVVRTLHARGAAALERKAAATKRPRAGSAGQKKGRAPA